MLSIGCLIGSVLGAVAAPEKQGAGLTTSSSSSWRYWGVSVPYRLSAPWIQRYFAVEWQLFPIQGWKGWIYAVLPIMAAASPTSPTTPGCCTPACWTPWARDYIYTAKSKGLNQGEIVRKHMLRNFLPLVTSPGSHVACSPATSSLRRSSMCPASASP